MSSSFLPDSTPRKVLFAVVATMSVFMVYCVIRAKTNPRRLAAASAETPAVTAPVAPAAQ